MYKTIGAKMMRRNVQRLNEGDYRPLLTMYADDATLSFPGDNAYAEQFRPVEKGRRAHTTHRGKAEIEAFLQRYVAQGIQMEIGDILMAGPPWDVRVAARGQTFIPLADGTDRYNNRAMIYLRMKWGKVVEHEDYEDTQRVTVLADGTVQSTPRPS